MAKAVDFIKIDIHGQTADEAKKKLLQLISNAPPHVKRIVVIHGSNNGTVLRDMVRKRIKSPCIYEIIPTYSNDGETTIYLK